MPSVHCEQDSVWTAARIANDEEWAGEPGEHVVRVGGVRGGERQSCHRLSQRAALQLAHVRQAGSVESRTEPGRVPTTTRHLLHHNQRRSTGHRTLVLVRCRLRQSIR